MKHVTLHEQHKHQEIPLLSEKYMEEHWDELDKDEVSLYQPMSIRFLLKYADEINWKLYSVNSHITMDAIEYFTDRISWVNFCINGKLLNESVIYNYRDHMIWSIVLNKQQLGLRLLIVLSELYRKNPTGEKEQDFWKAVSRYQDFDIEYAAEYGQYIDWKIASSNTLLNELVLQGFLQKLDLRQVISTRKLSEDFLYKNGNIIKEKLGLE